MFSFIFDFLSRIEARIKHQERLRIRRLEADLAQTKLALGFYSRRENYPAFLVAGQQGAVLGDGGARARQTLKSLKLAIPGRTIDVALSLAEAQDALRALPLPTMHAANDDQESVSWATYRDDAGEVRSERRAVKPA